MATATDERGSELVAEALTMIAEARTIPERDALGYRLLTAFDSSPDFAAYVEWLEREDGDLMLGIDRCFLGFIEDYFWLSRYFHPPVRGPRGTRKRSVVVDVGCCAALQQVFFRGHDAYVGIDLHGGFQRDFHGSATFIKGNFADLVESGEFEVTEEMVGIANMSLLYACPDQDRNLRAFDRFRRKAIR